MVLQSKKTHAPKFNHSSWMLGSFSFIPFETRIWFRSIIIYKHFQDCDILCLCFTLISNWNRVLVSFLKKMFRNNWIRYRLNWASIFRVKKILGFINFSNNNNWTRQNVAELGNISFKYAIRSRWKTNCIQINWRYEIRK